MLVEVVLVVVVVFVVLVVVVVVVVVVVIIVVIKVVVVVVVKVVIVIVIVIITASHHTNTSISFSPSLRTQPEAADKRLSNLTVEGLFEVFSKVEGVSTAVLPAYKDRLLEQNINGKVLLHCNLDDLKKVSRVRLWCSVVLVWCCVVLT